MRNARTCCAWLTTVIGCLVSAVVTQAARAEGAGDVAEMPEMVVTATRTEKDLHNVPGSVEVIGREQIGALNVRDIGELFKTVAGVDLQGSGVPGTAVRLNMRGLTTGYQSQNVLVLVDGRRINDQYQGNVEFALLPADNVERIEILRGPASALYGSSAMGGVINIITRRGSEMPFTEVSGAGGSYETQLYKAAHGWKIDRFDYFLTGSHANTVGYLDNGDGTDRDWQARNFTSNFGYSFDEDSQARLFLGYYDGTGTDENSDRDVQKDYQDLRYAWNWNDDADAALSVRLYRNGEHHNYDWKFPGQGRYSQYTLGAEVQQSLWLGEKHRVTLGFEARRDAVDIDEVLADIDEDMSTLGFYLQDEFNLTDDLQFTAGIRYDASGDYDGEVSPRFGVLYRFMEGTEVYASVNRAFRAPSLSDQHARNQFGGMAFEGNPDLEPQTMMAYEAGLRRRFTDSLEGEVAAFYWDLKDFWDYMRDPDGVFRTRNIAEVRSYGVETTIRFRVSQDMSGFLNYTYTKATIEEYEPDPSIKGNVLEDLARHKANLGVDLKLPKNAGLHLRVRYVGPRFTDAQNTVDDKLDDYAIADIRLNVPLSDNLRLTLNVDNVFNSGYADFADFRQPGRNFMAGAELRF